MERALPLGAEQWEQVALEYNRALPRGVVARDTQALRMKFTRLKNAKKPTGID